MYTLMKFNWFTGLTLTTATSNPIFISYLLGNNFFHVQLQLPTAAIVDGRIVSISPTFDVSSQTILMTFPGFHTLAYDPSLSVLLTSSNSDNRNSVCSGSSDNTLLVPSFAFFFPLNFYALSLDHLDDGVDSFGLTCRCNCCCGHYHLLCDTKSVACSG